MPTRDLTSKFVETATSNGKPREVYWDATLPGFGLMVTAKGSRSFVLQYRNAEGFSRRMTINGGKTLGQARRDAKAKIGDIAKGGDPMADKRKQRDARADTLRRIVEDEYLVDDDVKKLRSIDEKKGVFRRYIFPALGSRPITEIRRSEIVMMLRKVKSQHGHGASNNTFKVLSAFFNWYIPLADDDFNNPIVRGTWSQTKGEGSRTLTDDEIRILWNVASEGRFVYDHFIRFTLLTATRRAESAEMTRAELSPDGTEWTIPAARYKGQDGKNAHAHLIPLSPLARQVLSGVPDIGGRFVFTSNGRSPISGFSKFKKNLDERLFLALEREGGGVRKRIVADLNERYPGQGYEPFDGRWQNHSLRKTARTLLSRIGTSTSTAERCLGHVEGGIKSIYNHHEAKHDKRTAFEALAREVERIADGKPGNVIPMARA
jgi:integrase